MFPVRCYTCNAVVADRHLAYVARTRAGEHPRDVLGALGVDRLCCRRMFLAHVDLVQEQLAYPNVDVTLDESGTLLHRRCRSERRFVCD